MGISFSQDKKFGSGRGPLTLSTAEPKRSRLYRSQGQVGQFYTRKFRESSAII